MKLIKNKFLNTLVVLLSTQLVNAEDIELYTGGISSAVQPNVLFIMDTSSGMNANISTSISSSSYDPAATYTVPSGDFDFDTGKIYYDNSAASGVGASSSNYINVSSNDCSYLTTNLASVGFISINGRQFNDAGATNSRDWESVSSTYHDRTFECEYDEDNSLNTAPDNYVQKKDASAYKASAPSGSNKVAWGGSSKWYYSGHYLNWHNYSSGSSSGTISKRIELVQYVLKSVLDQTAGINTGLMRFTTNGAGGYVVHGVEDIATSRAAIKTEIDNLTTGGGTPLAETMYEAYLYFRGDAIDQGSGLTAANAKTGTDYDSPIDSQCQRNFVVFLTDGSPSSDNGRNTEIEAIAEFAGVNGSASCDGNCLDEITKIMNDVDQNGVLSGIQNINTYLIGFGLSTSSAYMESVATAGGGQVYTTDEDIQTLTDAFTSILSEILAVNTTFTSPAVSVNAFSKTTHRADLYYSLFKPSDSSHWSGNLKKFKLEFPGDSVIIADATSTDAVDSSTGFFKETARSYWTDASVKDGGDVALGGAASIFTPPRTLYTYTSGADPSDVDITDSAHEVSITNKATLKAFIDPSSSLSSTDLDNVINYGLGYDVNDVYGAGTSASNKDYGDPLHSKPIVVQYGGSEESPDLTIFYASNDGMLRAINESTGNEIFSFIPQDLLINLKTTFFNTTSSSKQYGLDGSINALVIDTNEDGIISGATEKVIVYVGMRRGGRNLYALDVTDRSNPKLLWRIKGGSGNYTELGQTWSYPKVKKIKYNTVEKDVLIFGGGYDTSQDSVTTKTADSQGRAIYVVDALTGTRLWWSSFTGAGSNHDLADLKYSIPSEILTVNLIGDDDLVDRIYFGDMGGQIWRFDVKDDNTGSDLFDGFHLLASLADSTASGNRKFFYPPEAAIVASSTDTTFIALILGSGNRSHPLDTVVEDRIYMVKDRNVFTNPSSAVTTVSESDLTDVTTVYTKAEKDAKLSTLSSSNGWRIEFGSGEKILSEGIVVDLNVVAISSFTPVSSSSSCSPSQGVGTTYFLNLLDAQAAYNTDKTGDDTTATSEHSQGDRGIVRVTPGIPPSFPHIFVEGEKPTTGDLNDETRDNDKIGGEIKGVVKSYWYEDRGSN